MTSSQLTKNFYDHSLPPLATLVLGGQGVDALVLAPAGLDDQRVRDASGLHNRFLGNICIIATPADQWSWFTGDVGNDTDGGTSVYYDLLLNRCIQVHLRSN